MQTKLPSVALATLLAIPGFALAQSTSAPPHSAAPMTPATTRPATNDNSAPSSATYITADRMERASKIIGATVYNDQNESVGSVDELLIGDHHDIFCDHHDSFDDDYDGFDDDH